MSKCNQRARSICEIETLEKRRLLASAYAIFDEGPGDTTTGVGGAGIARVNDSYLAGSYTPNGHDLGYYEDATNKLFQLGPVNVKGLTDVEVFDISENDITVGNSNDGVTGGKDDATKWIGNIPTDLGAGEATAISSDGAIIVGDIPFKNGKTTTQHAAIYGGSKPVDLGDLGGSAHMSLAYGVSTSGVIVGNSSVGSKTNTAPFYYDPKTKKMTMIGTSQSSPGDAYAINDAGIVTGEYNNRAFAFDVNTKTLTPYASPAESGTFQDSFALDINNANEAVGVSQYTSGVFATIWENGVPTDLNTLIPADSGIHLLFAKSISDTGEVLAVGTTSKSSAEDFLLYPERTSVTSKGTLIIQGSIAPDNVSVVENRNKIHVGFNDVLGTNGVGLAFTKSHVKRLNISLMGGSDLLTLGAGLPAANISAGAGNDKLLIRDGAPDVVDGGPGKDQAQIDKGDTLSLVEKVLP